MSEKTFTNMIMERIGFVPKEDSPQGVDGLYPSPFSARQEQRRKEMALYWDYYRGNQRPPLKISKTQPDLNTIENYSALIVNLSNQFLFGGGCVLEIDEDSRNQSDEEVLLNDIFNDVLYITLGQAGSVTGTPILRVFPQGDDIPRVVVVDPAGVEIFTNGDDLTDITEYRQTWWGGECWERQRITREDDRWYIIAEKRSQNGKWERVDDETEPWTYSVPPMFVGQNIPQAFQKYGLSDLTNANLQDSINRVSSDTGKIIYHHAAPLTKWKGGQGKIKIQRSGGATIVPLSGEQDLENLELQSDLESSGKRRDSLINSFLFTSDTPNLNAETIQLGAVSGFALQLSMMPALGKMNVKRMTYGRIIEGAAALCLEIMGKPSPVTAKFGSPLPMDKDAMTVRWVAMVGQNTDPYNAALVAGFTAEDAELLAARRLLIPASPLDAVVDGA